MTVQAHSSQYDPQSLLNSQPVIVTVIDPSTYRVEFQNQQPGRKIRRYRGKSCHRRLPAAIHHADSAVWAKPFDRELTTNQVPLPNGQTLLVHWAKTVTESGQYTIETISDISDHKRIEEELRQAQKMEAVGRMASGLAHDFNNLLMVINGFTARLLAKHGSDPNLAHLQIIGDAGARAAALTKKLLAFSRQQPIQLEAVDLNHVIQNFQNLLTKSVGEHVRTTLNSIPRSQKFRSIRFNSNR